jgi:hypothetical protein
MCRSAEAGLKTGLPALVVGPQASKVTQLLGFTRFFLLYFLLTMTTISDVLSPAVIASAIPLSWMIWWIVSLVEEETAREFEREKIGDRVPDFPIKRTNTFCVLFSVESRLCL